MSDNFRENFSQLYDKYIDKIYRFVYFKVSSQEIAEDLTSEAFIRYWDSVKKDPSRIDNAQAFLYQIARNLVTDHYRDKGRSQTVSTDDIYMADPRPSIEEKACDISDVEMIKANMANIKDDYKDVIIWRYVEELPMSEIAELTGKSEGAVRVLIHRALKSLRNEIENKGGFEV